MHYFILGCSNLGHIPISVLLVAQRFFLAMPLFYTLGVFVYHIIYLFDNYDAQQVASYVATYVASAI